MREINMQPTKSVEKALKILNCFSHDQQYLKIETISKLIGAPKSTTYRLLCTLEAYKLVYYNPEDLTYCLGMKFLEYSAIVLDRTKVRSIASPYLISLSQKTGFSVNLAIMEGEHFYIVDKAESVSGIGITSTVGRARLLHFGSPGKVFMAEMDEEAVRRYLQNVPLKKYADDSITDPEKYIAELQKVREQGYAIDHNEAVLNASGISAPIRNRWGQLVAVLSLIGPSRLIREYPMEELVRQVLGCGQQISQELENV